MAPSDHSPTRVAPLWLALLITFLGSLGTGAATNGVFFVTAVRYDFGRAENLWLGVLMGAVFIPSAFCSGRITRWLERRAGLSEKAVLALVLASIALVCTIPGLIDDPLAVWLFVVLFSPLTGLLWPLVEGFVSGGRRARALRAATGRFNLAWATATFASYWLMKPLLVMDPALVFFMLAGVHALAACVVAGLPKFPPRHASGAHEHDPQEAASYRRLLTCFRMLLMGSYVLHSAMTPLLPARFEQLGVDETDAVLYASAWMGSRILAFAVLERWHGWHGRRRTLIWAGGGMALGFAGVLLAPGPWWAVGALVLLGIGIGSAYAAALYYAMEVGNAEVDAGGAHEAMIGIGYMGGPLAALLAVGAAEVGWIPRVAIDAWVLAAVGSVGVAIGLLILRRARRPLATT